MCYYGYIMKRTSIMLPEELRARAGQRAGKLGISLGELIRRSLEAMLARDVAPEEDPLLTDEEVYDGPVPEDLASAHDRYLYGGDGP
jgi:hypothetical protein